MLKRLFQNPYIMIAPTVLLLCVFSYYPFVSALGFAFYRWPYITQPPEFAGLDNFRAMLSDAVLWKSFGNMAVLLVADVLKVLCITTLVAELIFSLRSPRLAQFYRTALVLPMVVPGIVGLYIWQSFYMYDGGLINQLIWMVERSSFHHWLLSSSWYPAWRGLSAEAARQIVAQWPPPPDVLQSITLARAWLGDPSTALGAFIFMGFPWCGGVAVLIVLAGLYSIPQDIFDCARVDGIGTLRRVFLIDIHLIAGQLKLLVVLSMLGSIQGFMAQMILTDGGPSDATLVPALHLIHHAFKYRNLGYGAAIAVLLFVIMLALTFINMRYIRSSEEVV